MTSEMLTLMLRGKGKWQSYTMSIKTLCSEGFHTHKRTRGRRGLESRREKRGIRGKKREREKKDKVKIH